MKPLPQASGYEKLSKNLNAIKGLAMLMMVSLHLWGYTKGKFLTIPEIIDQSQGQGIKGLMEGLLSIWCALGEYGVHIFIIASGFGLAASWWRKQINPTSKNNSLSLIPFWKRRVLRIFPLYWMAHGVAEIIALISLSLIPRSDLLTQGIPESLTAILASLTTLRNFSVDYNFFLNPAWWYVGLAVQLYLVFPFLIKLGKRWGWSQLLVGSLIINLVYRIIILALPLSGKLTAIYLRGAFFPTRIFEFVFGIVLAISLLNSSNAKPRKSFSDFFHWSKKLLLKRRYLPLNLLFYVVGVACDSAADSGFLIYKIPADALLGVGEFCLLFQLFLWFPKLKVFCNPLGYYSYGIYLIHMNTLRLFWIWLLWLPSYWLRFTVVCALCCFCGGCFEYIYHWSMQGLRKKKVAF